MDTTAKLVVDGDKTRRKRLKVVSACGECRRKKTKCNGEKPCAGCLKAHVECKYVFTQKPNMSTAKIIPIQEKAPSSPSSSSSETQPNSIESIEERLGAIENILRTLLGSGKNKHLLQGLQVNNQQQQQQQQQQQHSDSLCGDMYSSSSPHLVHAPHTQNRRLAREKRKRHEDDQEGVTETKKSIRDDFGHGYNKLQLAPIKIMNPGTPTIRNLLNQDDNTKWFPSPPPPPGTAAATAAPVPLPPPTATSQQQQHHLHLHHHHQQPNNNSAFFRMSSPNTNTNSATTAAGSSS